MLDLFGSGYAVEHCVSALLKSKENERCIIYMTDALYYIMHMMNGKEVIPRYYDVLHPAKKDERTAEEIADDIIKRNGLKVVSE